MFCERFVTFCICFSITQFHNPARGRWHRVPRFCYSDGAVCGVTSHRYIAMGSNARSLLRLSQAKYAMLHRTATSPFAVPHRDRLCYARSDQQVTSLSPSLGPINRPSPLIFGTVFWFVNTVRRCVQRLRNNDLCQGSF